MAVLDASCTAASLPTQPPMSRGSDRRRCRGSRRAGPLGCDGGTSSDSAGRLAGRAAERRAARSAERGGLAGEVPRTCVVGLLRRLPFERGALGDGARMPSPLGQTQLGRSGGVLRGEQKGLPVGERAPCSCPHVAEAEGDEHMREPFDVAAEILRPTNGTIMEFRKGTL